MIFSLMRKLQWIENLSKVIAPNSPRGREARWQSYLSAVDKAIDNQEYDLIEKHLEEARIWLESIPPDEPGLIKRTLRLGELYQELVGDNSTAEICYRQALALTETFRGGQDRRTAEVLTTLGLFLIQQRRFDEAEALLERVPPLIEKEFDRSHVEYATALENLAALFRQTNRLEEATELRAQAQRIRRNSKREGVTR